MPRRHDSFGRIPLWWKLWFGFCALLGLGFMGLIAWAIVRLVARYA